MAYYDSTEVLVYNNSVHSRQGLKIGLNSCRLMSVCVQARESICIVGRALYTEIARSKRILALTC